MTHRKIANVGRSILLAAAAAAAIVHLGSCGEVDRPVCVNPLFVVKGLPGSLASFQLISCDIRNVFNCKDANIFFSHKYDVILILNPFFKSDTSIVVIGIDPYNDDKDITYDYIDQLAMQFIDCLYSSPIPVNDIVEERNTAAVVPIYDFDSNLTSFYERSMNSARDYAWTDKDARVFEGLMQVIRVFTDI